MYQKLENNFGCDIWNFELLKCLDPCEKRRQNIINKQDYEKKKKKKKKMHDLFTK